ncbi:MAG: insulinase family protein [Bacteroides sp.]|nr:insulinase family protein [Bacteroides sp.]
MPNKFQRREIGKNIFFSSITDPRFKLNMISVNFLVPLSEETASEYALVARILNKSCAAYPTFAELNNKLSSLYAARIDSGVMSFGDSQSLTVSVQYIDNKYALENEKIEEEAAGIFLGCLLEPFTENGVFSEKVTSLERQILIDDIESEINDKQTYANHRASQIMFKDEPAAVRSLGSVEQAKRTAPLTAFNAYKRLLKNARTEIICSGCSDFKAVEKTLSRAFSQLERGEAFRCGTLKSPLKEKPRYVTEKMPVAQSKLAIGFKTDSENYPALHIMNAIYGGSTTSKLFMNVREKMSLCYYCWSGVNRNKGAMFVRSGVENKNIEKATEEIIAQLEAVKKGEFTDEDIEYAKMYRRNGLRTFNDSLNQMAAWYLMRIYDDDIKSPEDAVRESEAVTKEEIIAAAQSVKLDTVYALTSLDPDEEKTEKEEAQ